MVMVTHETGETKEISRSKGPARSTISQNISVWRITLSFLYLLSFLLIYGYPYKADNSETIV